MNYDEFVVTYHQEITPDRSPPEWENMLDHVVQWWVLRYHREMDKGAEVMVYAYMVVFMDMERTAVFVEAVEEALLQVPDWIEESGDWGYLRDGVDTEFLAEIVRDDDYDWGEE